MTNLKMMIFSYISFYSTVSTAEAAYIIGGIVAGQNIEEFGQIIAEFKNDSWRRIGKLSKGRWLHGSIALNEEIMVIGGAALDERLIMTV